MEIRFLVPEGARNLGKEQANRLIRAKTRQEILPQIIHEAGGFIATMEIPRQIVEIPLVTLPNMVEVDGFRISRRVVPKRAMQDYFIAKGYMENYDFVKMEMEKRWGESIIKGNESTLCFARGYCHWLTDISGTSSYELPSLEQFIAASRTFNIAKQLERTDGVWFEDSGPFSPSGMPLYGGDHYEFIASYDGKIRAKTEPIYGGGLNRKISDFFLPFFVVETPKKQGRSKQGQGLGEA